MCVVNVIVKRPVLPPCVVDRRSRNPLYYYYYYFHMIYFLHALHIHVSLVHVFYQKPLQKLYVKQIKFHSYHRLLVY